MVSIVHVAGFGTQGGTPSLVFGGPHRYTGEKYCTFPAKKCSGLVAATDAAAGGHGVCNEKPIA